MMFILLIAGFCFAMGLLAGWVIFSDRRKNEAEYAEGYLQAYDDVETAIADCCSCDTCPLVGIWDEEQRRRHEKNHDAFWKRETEKEAA